MINKIVVLITSSGRCLEAIRRVEKGIQENLSGRVRTVILETVQYDDVSKLIHELYWWILGEGVCGEGYG